MIPRGHEHYFQPVAVWDLPNGGKDFHRQCVCGLEERRVFRADGEPDSMRYRFAGLWLDPVDLLRLLPVPVSECPDCLTSPILGYVCGTCRGLGVVEDGERIAPPSLTAHV